jgi:hypothetical protein
VVKYVRDTGWKRVAEIAAARSELAASYRRMRKDNPALARLFWRRMNEAREALKRYIFGSLVG